MLGVAALPFKLSKKSSAQANECPLKKNSIPLTIAYPAYPLVMSFTVSYQKKYHGKHYGGIHSSHPSITSLNLSGHKINQTNNRSSREEWVPTEFQECGFVSTKLKHMLVYTEPIWTAHSWSNTTEGSWGLLLRPLNCWDTPSTTTASPRNICFWFFDPTITGLFFPRRFTPWDWHKNVIH